VDRDVPAVFQRPDPLAPETARPLQHPIEAARTDCDGLVTEHLTLRRHDAGDGVRALVHARTEHDHRPVPFVSRLKWTAGGHDLLRARPRSFQVTPNIPTGDERHNKRKSGHRPTASKRVSSPPVETISTASDITDTESKQQASMQQRGDHRDEPAPERRPRSHNVVSGGIRSVASAPSPTTVTVPQAAESGSSITNKPNADWPNRRARLGSALKTAACAVPPVNLAATCVEEPAVPQITYA
jgi:hypothetical protein